MTTSTTQLPRLHARCTELRREIVMLSGLTEAALDDASTEISTNYEIWCAGYKGPDLADPVMGFCEMLHQWPAPWPYNDESSLNGLTLAQFFLVQAYSDIEFSLAILGKRQTRSGLSCTGFVDDDAACSAVYAAKELTHAKGLLASSENVVAQATDLDL